MPPPTPVLVVGGGERGYPVLSRVGASCRSLYGLRPHMHASSPTPTTEQPSGARVPFEQTAGFQQEERAEQSGAAAGSLRVELSPLWPTGPFPSCRLSINHGVQWARQEPSQAGDVPEWEVGDWRNAGALPRRLLLGRGSRPFAPSHGGLGFRCGGEVRFAELHAFLKVHCLPAIPLSTCCPCLPAVLPHCWKAVCNPPSLFALPDWGYSIFPSHPF